MSYVEQQVAPGVELWRSESVTGTQRILPDGCLDLIYDGARLHVAGPDSTARLNRTTVPTTYTGIRLHAGLGPAALGIPADEICDQYVPLTQLWGARPARSLTDSVARAPGPALVSWALGTPPDPFGLRLRAALAAGHSVAAAADSLGFSTRQLQRRTRATFGYGPQHLARVLRLLQAVHAADRGASWTAIAPAVGYADQAHLAETYAH